MSGKPSLPSSFPRGPVFLFNLLSPFLFLFPPIPFFIVSSPTLPICALQGSGFASPYAGQTVTTQGVVFFDLDETSRKGFFLQEENCDSDPATSDGIFVYLGARTNVVSAGDRVRVTGTVQEYDGMTELSASPGSLSLLATNQVLPALQELSPPADIQASRLYFESREAMLVGIGEVVVVGPTDTNDRSWVVRSDSGIDRVFNSDPAGSGEIVCVDDGGLYEISPEVKVGDQVSGLAGVLDDSRENYCLELANAPVVLPAVGSSFSSPQAADLSVATFNLNNLFDTYDDPATEDTQLSTAEYQRRLQKRALLIHAGLGEPDLLAVQEVETGTVLQHLINRPEIQADYQVIWEDGPDRRGLDLALLYRPEHLSLLGASVRQACTTLVDGFGPDGNDDVSSPQNLLSCDTNGDGLLDGNRLFSRPPLVAHFAAFLDRATGYPVDLWVILVHLKSKTEDTSTNAYTLPRRLEQAGFVAGIAQDILASYPKANLIILGDFNDTLDSQTLSIISASGQFDLLHWTPEASRYSYVYHGVSQVLDHVLARWQPPFSPVRISPIHVNADYPDDFSAVGDSLYRSSDHDPVLAQFRWFDQVTYLPLVSTRP